MAYNIFKNKIVATSSALLASICLSGCNPEQQQTPEEAEYTKTKYPIVMVHGLYGFDDLIGIENFYKVPAAMRRGGATLHVVTMSGINTPEVRGEQLIQKLDELVAITGEKKYNLIAHSLGSPTSRYVASTRPDLVASVSSVAGVNDGTGLADNLAGIANTPIVGDILHGAGNLFGGIIDVIQGERFPHDTRAGANAMSQAGMTVFNKKYPDAVPAEYCGQGEHIVKGIAYYSWTGNVVRTNRLDIFDPLHILNSWTMEGIENDGFVPKCSTHLGKVIRNDYPHNHFDYMNWFLGLHGSDAPDPRSIYRAHANRLKLDGL